MRKKKEPYGAKKKPTPGMQKKAGCAEAILFPAPPLTSWKCGRHPTFDPKTIDRELGYAQSIGFNAMRVFLHHVAWQEDHEGFKNRMKQYLSIADKHHIGTIFVIFDDCWNDNYHAGKQPAPKTGIHNSGWLRDPGTRYHTEPLLGDTLRIM